MGGGCANTVRGVKQDAERATEKTAAAVETVDVKVGADCCQTTTRELLNVIT